VTGSIYSTDPRVDRPHLFSILSYHPMKIHTLSIPTFGLSCCVRDLVGPQCWVLLYPLTRLLCSSKQNCLFWWIPFRCRERCGALLTVGSLPASSITSLRQPWSGASLSYLTGSVEGLLWLYSTTICSQVDCMTIYREFWVMDAKLWCSQSCDWNKDEYDNTKCLVVM